MFRSNKDGANTKIDSSFEAGSRKYWFGKYIAEYVTRQQTLDRQVRADWRDAQEFYVEEKKRADEIRLAEIQAEAEAEEKKRADESHIKIQIAQIEAAKEQAKIDKELKIKEMELQAQAQATASSATTPPPRNKDAKSPKQPSFIDKKVELDSYLLRFECYAENASWECTTDRKSHGRLYQDVRCRRQ